MLRCLPLGFSATKPNTIMGPKHATKAHFVPVYSESSDEEPPSSDESLSGLGGMLDGASDYPPNRGRKGVDWEAGPSSGKGASQNRNSRGRSKNQHSKDWENIAERKNNESSTDTQLDLSRGSHSRRENKVPPGGMINPTAGVVGCANGSVAALVSPAVVININSNSAPSGIKDPRAPPRRGKAWEVQSDEESSDSTVRRVLSFKENSFSCESANQYNPRKDTPHDGRTDHNRRQTSHSNTKGANPGKSSKSRDRNSKSGPNMPGAWTDPVDQDKNQASWNDDDKGSNAAFGDNNEPKHKNNSDWGAGEDNNGNDNHWSDNEKEDDRNANSKGWDGKKKKKGVGNNKKAKKREVSNNDDAWGNSADNEGWGNDNTGPDAPDADNNNTNGSSDGNGNGNGSPAAWDSPEDTKNQSQKGSWDSPNENKQQNGWGADDDGKTQQNNSGSLLNTQKKGQKQKSNSPNDQQNSWGDDNHDDKPQRNNAGQDHNNGDAQKSGWETEHSGNAQQNSSGGDNNGNAQQNSWAADNEGDDQQNNLQEGNNGDTQQKNWAGDNHDNTQSNDWVEDKNDTQQNSGNIPSKNTQASGGKVADKDSWRKPPYPVTGKPPYSPQWPPR